MNKIEIYTSKKKAILLLIGSLILIIGGALFAINPELFLSDDVEITNTHRTIGIAAALFFSSGFFAGIKSLKQSGIAIIIDDKGLSISPEMPSKKFIGWEDIAGFEEVKVHGQKILTIKFKDPENWIEKETNPVQRKLMKYSLGQYGSPLSISSNNLKISYKDLLDKLNSSFEKFGKK